MKAGPSGEIGGIQVVLDSKENNANTDTRTVNNDDFVSNNALNGNEWYSKWTSENLDYLLEEPDNKGCMGRSGNNEEPGCCDDFDCAVCCDDSLKSIWNCCTGCYKGFAKDLLCDL